MKKLLIAVLMPLLLMLSACGEDLLQGDVTDKSVEAAYTIFIPLPIYTTTCSGNPVSCTQSIVGYIPIPYYIPPCYRIYGKGEVSGDTCLDKTEWETIAVGDYYEGKDVKPEDRKKKAYED